MSVMTIRHRLLTVLAIGAATVAVAGCGGSSPGNGSAGQQDDSKRLAFAQCLRKAGIDAPDPKTSASGEVSQRIRVPKGIGPERMRQITADCAKKTGGGPKPMSKEDQAKFRDAALKFAQCMRAHGVDVPDPQVGSGRGILIQKSSAGAGSSGPKIDPESPAFQSAQKACQSLLPGGGPKGGMATQHSDGKVAGASVDSVSKP
jgi:hypothetical protein